MTDNPTIQHRRLNNRLRMNRGHEVVELDDRGRAREGPQGRWLALGGTWTPSAADAWALHKKRLGLKESTDV